MRDDVDHPGREPGLFHDLRDEQSGDTGDSSDGFSTTVLPNASGLTTVRQASTWAPFQGEIPATTPSGRRSAIANVPGTSDRITSPTGR